MAVCPLGQTSKSLRSGINNRYSSGGHHLLLELLYTGAYIIRLHPHLGAIGGCTDENLEEKCSDSRKWTFVGTQRNVFPVKC